MKTPSKGRRDAIDWDTWRVLVEYAESQSTVNRLVTESLLELNRRVLKLEAAPKRKRAKK